MSVWIFFCFLEHQKIVRKKLCMIEYFFRVFLCDGRWYFKLRLLKRTFLLFIFVFPRNMCANKIFFSLILLCNNFFLYAEKISLCHSELLILISRSLHLLLFKHDFRLFFTIWTQQLCIVLISSYSEWVKKNIQLSHTLPLNRLCSYWLRQLCSNEEKMPVDWRCRNLQQKTSSWAKESRKIERSFFLPFKVFFFVHSLNRRKIWISCVYMCWEKNTSLQWLNEHHSHLTRLFYELYVIIGIATQSCGEFYLSFVYMSCAAMIWWKLNTNGANKFI